MNKVVGVLWFVFLLSFPFYYLYWQHRFARGTRLFRAPLAYMLAELKAVAMTVPYAIVGFAIIFLVAYSSGLISDMRSD